MFDAYLGDLGFCWKLPETESNNHNHHIINLQEYYHHLEQTSNDKHPLLLFLLIKPEFVW